MRKMSAGRRFATLGGPASVGAALRSAVARQITKQVGSNIQVRVDFTPDTRDPQGNLISWPYRVRVIMIQARPFATDVHLETRTSSQINQASGTATAFFTFTTPDVSDPIKFDVHVDARPSSEAGTPLTTSWDEVAFQTEEDAVQPVPGAADPDAQISSITVSQRLRDEFAFPAPAGRPFQYGARAAQTRPAGGFAFPEALIPPDMDVRQHRLLPGPARRLPRV